MDLPITANLTYHSRRKNQDSTIHAFTPLNLPLKLKQNEQKRPSIISNFGTRQQFFSNPSIKQAPSYANISPIAMLQGSEEKRDIKSTLQLEQQRQKVKTLSEHLKSALLSNNEIEERCNLMKKKMQQKEMKFMNETSVLKAELIILQKEFADKNDEIRRKNEEINQLKMRLEKSQRSQKMIQQKYQLQVKHSEALKNSLVDQRIQEAHLSELKQTLLKKDRQISTLSEEVKYQQTQLNQYESIVKQQEQQVLNIQAEFRESQNLYNSLLSENQSIKEKLEFQKNRIEELNQHITEICLNSDHLFQEIKETKLQKDILNQKIDQKQLQKISLETKLQQMIENCHAYEIKCQELKMGQEILDEKNRQLTEKYTQLQEENLQFSRINTELLREIQTLDQEVKELKEICLRQEKHQIELLSVIKDMEAQILQLRREIDSEAVLKLREEVRKQIQPTRDVERRIKTEKNEYFTPYEGLSQNLFQSKIPKQNPNEAKGRFDYLSKYEKCDNDPKQKQVHPYSQFLSFEPSQPYESTKSKPLEENYRQRTYTLGNDVNQEYNPTNRDLTILNNYYLPNYKSQIQNDRKSKSFYVERKNLLVAGSDDVYKSSLNPRERQYSSIKEMRRSLDMREKSLNLHSMTKNSGRQNPTFSKNRKHQKLHTETLGHSNPYESKDMFLSKLGKLKLWSKQVTSQQTTEREALSELPTSNDYLKAEVPIQTIIKQKSTILQQRKNLLTFNLNNQMIQKNILKLQKNGETQKIKENCVEGLSMIRERKEGNNHGIKDAVYNVCKKVLYN